MVWMRSLGNKGHYTFNGVFYDFDLTLSDDGQSMNGTDSSQGMPPPYPISFVRR